MDYLFHLATMICIYTILAQSLSLASGYTKQISLSHAAFFGIGAYAAAILSKTLSVDVLWSFTIASLICVIVGGLIGLVIVRAVDEYFVVLSIGVQLAVVAILYNWQSLTNGPIGIVGIPPASVFGFELDANWEILMLSLCAMVIVWILLHRILNSNFGRVLKGICEDELLMQSLGKDVLQSKATAFALGSMFAAPAGVLYAHKIGFIDPSSFLLSESIYVLSIVIIGGMQRLGRIFLAASILVLLPECLRFIGFGGSVAANLQQITYGAALFLIAYIYRDRVFHMSK